MIAIAHTTSSENGSQAQFLAMLPKIRRQALAAFRSADPDAREEFVAEVVANAYRAVVRLVELGKQDTAFATPLAQYAIRQIRSGRRVGGTLGSRDIMSQHASTQHGFVRQPLYERDQVTGEWCELLVEDRTAGPAETAAARVDFAAWRRRLPRRWRQIALALARGETTKEAAEQFRLSSARISQVRQLLRESWENFQGSPAPAVIHSTG